MQDTLACLDEGLARKLLAFFGQLHSILEQLDERLHEGPYRLPRQFVTQFRQSSAEQMDQAALLGASQAVVGRVEIADQGACKGFPQDADDDLLAAMAIDEEQGAARVAEAPGPGYLAVDAAAGRIPLDYRPLPEQFEQFLDDGSEQLAAPTQMAQQASPTDGQAEEIMKQVLRLTRGNAEMGAGITGQQARAWTDVGVRQFQITAVLTGSLTGAAAVHMATIAVPLDFGFGHIGDDVILELTGGFEVAGTAMGTLPGNDVVLHKDGAGRRFGAKGTRVLAVFLAAPVRACVLGFRAWMRAFPALPDLLEFVLQLRQPTTQLGVLRS